MKRQLPILITLIALFALTASTAWAGGAKVQVCHIPPGNPANFHTITISENALQAHLGHGDLAGACFAHCDTLCSDGNACTIDACDASERCVSTHPPVNCDDGSLCTIDSCNPATGCASLPKTCTDADNCTVNACDPLTGACVAPPVVCPAGQSCNPANGECAAAAECPCITEVPGFIEALNGEFGLTACHNRHVPAGAPWGGVDLTTGDGRTVGSEFSPSSFKACGFFYTDFRILSEEEVEACNTLIRAKAAAAGLTCTPPI